MIYRKVETNIVIVTLQNQKNGKFAFGECKFEGRQGCESSILSDSYCAAYCFYKSHPTERIKVGCNSAVLPLNSSNFCPK